MARKENTVLHLARELDAGRTSSRRLVEEALARIADPAGEGARSFRVVYREQALAAAEAQDKLRQAGYKPSPLAGLPVSIKDLFDVKGETTLAGSIALDDAAPAPRDAAIVARLKAAGAVIIGRTNMTEFAFSGVGINPHYGTPGNPWDRKRIPGGSSSGAGVSVADAQCVVAIGTDTGGSVRIPAALCGVVGFKPTQFRVPREGCVPLSTTLDSIGPLGNSVACCAIADAVMAGEPPVPPRPIAPRGLRLALPRGSFFFDELDAEVAAAFERACAILSRAGAQLEELALPELAELGAINAKGGFSPPEAYAWHAELIARRGADYDPRVRQRIARGAEVSAADYVRLIAERAHFNAAIAARTRLCDALLVPGVAVIAPPIADFADDAVFFRLNARILRNPNPVNFLDGCAISLPIAKPGEAPVGLMLIGEHGEDKRLFAMAAGIEDVLDAGLAR
ncbi:MAG TPA: amidase [Stellaceae bacterium]|nr:amidase [Stellaceae bacterium]